MKGWAWCVGVLGVVGVSSGALVAATLAGGPVFAGGGHQAEVRCMVVNVGPVVATFTGKHILKDDGTAVDLNFDSCGLHLQILDTCVIIASAVEQVAHSCRFLFRGGGLRGTLAVYDDAGNMLHSSDMR